MHYPGSVPYGLWMKVSEILHAAHIWPGEWYKFTGQFIHVAKNDAELHYALKLLNPYMQPDFQSDAYGITICACNECNALGSMVHKSKILDEEVIKLKYEYAKVNPGVKSAMELAIEAELEAVKAAIDEDFKKSVFGEKEPQGLKSFITDNVPKQSKPITMESLDKLMGEIYKPQVKAQLEAANPLISALEELHGKKYPALHGQFGDPDYNDDYIPMLDGPLNGKLELGSRREKFFTKREYEVPQNEDGSFYLLPHQMLRYVRVAYRATYPGASSFDEDGNLVVAEIEEDFQFYLYAPVGEDPEGIFQRKYDLFVMLLWLQLGVVPEAADIVNETAPIPDKVVLLDEKKWEGQILDAVIYDEVEDAFDPVMFSTYSPYAMENTCLCEHLKVYHFKVSSGLKNGKKAKNSKLVCNTCDCKEFKSLKDAMQAHIKNLDKKLKAQQQAFKDNPWDDHSAHLEAHKNFKMMIHGYEDVPLAE